jgi:hypothetical protein
MLSNMMRSTPAASASSTSSGVVVSTSTFRRSTLCSATARTAAVIPPAAAMWLSLISTMSWSPKRWLAPPPARTASFSRCRIPGVVLRVSITRAPVPSTART